MLFNSIEFICFLPIVFIVYWLADKHLKWQNFLVVTASYIFYGWWDIRFLSLIILTSSFCFVSGLLIERAEGNRKKQKIINTINILLNIGILGTFKYFDFFSTNIETALHSLGFEPDWITLDVLLPVGISFYTLQALSYSIDVYQKKISACHDPIAFFAFVSFFPQLVAGPIERATNLLPQFYKRRTFDYSKAIDGCRQMLWGFFKKMIIADNCAMAVNEIWGSYQYQSGFTLLLGGLLFTFQIYGDFSGYSDIAIGCARLFGIDLMKNFNYPYFSRDISEFWRRWHISLSTWFREYLYIPLGGNRKGQVRTYVNLLIVFFATGLWHGAGATFIIWGLYHGLFLVVERMGLGKLLEKNCFRGLNHIYTALVVVVGWVFFRADTLADAKVILHQMFTWENGIYPASLFVNRKVIFLAVLGVLLSGIVQSICPKLREHLYEKEVTKTVDIVIMAVLLFLCTMYLVSSTYNPFIYFRF